MSSVKKIIKSPSNRQATRLLEKSQPIKFRQNKVSTAKLHETTSSPKSFYERFSIKPYEAQARAIDLVFQDRSVFVDVPTGSGKTLVAEAAIYRNINLSPKKQTIYTVPLKALANDKFLSLQKKFGEDNVGVVTGDRSENPDAKVVIMTTEIYRSKLNDSKFKDSLASVVFDEAHYICDPTRGSAWEDAIYFTPNEVQTIFLTASMYNSKEFQNWINRIKKREDGKNYLELVSSNHRLVGLEESIVDLDPPKKNNRGKVKEGVPIEKQKFDFLAEFFPPQDGDHPFAGTKLPVLYVCFKRDQCDDMAKEVKLSIKNKQAKYPGFPAVASKEQQNKLQKRITKAVQKNPELEFFEDDLELLHSGIASHHAGKIPALKSLIEELMDENLLSIVFATETLAAGINKPVQTVVLDTISKNNQGILSPKVYQQIIGRAGRKGFHDKGYVYVFSTTPETSEIIKERYFNKSQEEIKAGNLSYYDLDYPSLLEILNRGNYTSNYDTTRTVKERVDNSFRKFLWNRAREDRRKSKLESPLMKSPNQRIGGMVKVLKNLGLVDNQLSLTDKGRLCKSIRVNNPLFITELLSNKGIFQDLSPEQFIGLMGGFLFFESKTSKPYDMGDLKSLVKNIQLTDKNQDLQKQIRGMIDTITTEAAKRQAKNDQVMSSSKAAKRIYDWSQAKYTGKAESFKEFIKEHGYETKPNDFIREVKELVEILCSIQKSQATSDTVQALIRDSIPKIKKGIFFQNYGVGA